MVIAQDGNTMTDSAAILDALTGGKAAFAPLGGIEKKWRAIKDTAIL